MSAAAVNPKWATFSDLLKMAHLLVLSVGLSDLWPSVKLLVERLNLIGRRSGKKFLVLYLKECLRIVLAFLNFHPILSSQKGEIEVRRGNTGLPLVIPGLLRRCIAQFRELGGIRDYLVTRVVLSILRFYTVLQFKALPDLSPITGAFTGIGRNLDKVEVTTVLKLFKVAKMGGLTWSISEAAGPNGPKATWFAGADAIAFIFKPRLWFVYVCYSLLTRRFALLAWFLAIQILVLPVLPFIYLAKVQIPSLLGRLVSLQEGGGKRRIIAITDW